MFYLRMINAVRNRILKEAMNLAFSSCDQRLTRGNNFSSFSGAINIETAFLAKLVCLPRNNRHFLKILGRRR